MGGNDPIEPRGGKETGGIPGRDIWPVRAGRLARLGKAAGGGRSGESQFNKFKIKLFIQKHDKV